MGQRRAVTVVKFVMKGSVESRLHELATRGLEATQKKLAADNTAAVTAGGGGGKTREVTGIATTSRMTASKTTAGHIRSDTIHLDAASFDLLFGVTSQDLSPSSEPASSFSLPQVTPTPGVSGGGEDGNDGNDGNEVYLDDDDQVNDDDDDGDFVLRFRPSPQGGALAAADASSFGASPQPAPALAEPMTRHFSQEGAVGSAHTNTIITIPDTSEEDDSASDFE